MHAETSSKGRAGAFSVSFTSFTFHIINSATTSKLLNAFSKLVFVTSSAEKDGQRGSPWTQTPKNLSSMRYATRVQRGIPCHRPTEPRPLCIFLSLWGTNWPAGRSLPSSVPTAPKARTGNTIAAENAAAILSFYNFSKPLCTSN